VYIPHVAQHPSSQFTQITYILDNARLRDTSREGAISPVYHTQKLSPEINVVLVVGLKVFTQYGVIRH
jgi:hypothetical protein